MHLIGYVRILEGEPTTYLTAQRMKLYAWCRAREFVIDDIYEEITTPDDDPVEVDEALKAVLDDPLVDGFIVEELVCPFRSFKEARAAIELLDDENKVLVVTDRNLVFYPKQKVGMSALVRAFSDFHYEILNRRLINARAKRQKRSGGRPEIPVDIEKVKELLGRKTPMYTVAHQMGVSVSTLERRVNKWREEGLL